MKRRASSLAALDKEAMEHRLCMLGGEPGKVDRLPADRNQRCRPQSAKDHRAHEGESVEPWVAAPNLTPCLRFGDQNGDRSDRLRGDFIMPHARELGEIAQFADHHLRDGSDRDPAHILGKSGKEGGNDLGEG